MSHHPYDVACELVNQENSLRALIMAAMMKADKANYRRLAEAFPSVEADLIIFSHAAKESRERRKK